MISSWKTGTMAGNSTNALDIVLGDPDLKGGYQSRELDISRKDGNPVRDIKYMLDQDQWPG